LVKEPVAVDDFVIQANSLVAAISSPAAADSCASDNTTTGNSLAPRKRTRVVEILSPTKRTKHVQDSIDRGIEKLKKGVNL